jgi:hypothetical protein
MRLMDRIRSFPTFAALVLLTSGTAAAQTGAIQEVRYGPAVTLGEGTVRTYLVVDANGDPAELGFAISENALATLPDLADKPPMESFLTLDLEFPEGTPAPYRLAGFDWNPKGHPPVGVYTVPHFDFHFYTIDAATKNAIMPGETDAPGENFDFTGTAFEQRGMKAPPAGHLPAAYIYGPGSTVPMMGAHWVDPASHEFHGKPFDKTFIYGTWEGEVIFLEPMITKAYIESTPEGTIAITAPEEIATPGWYPAAYRVRFDSETKEYRIALTGFAERN